MKNLKTRIMIIATCFFFLVFFTNDFGLVDIKKTSIITAVAIDGKLGEYEVTVQIAVPEANDTNTENKRAVITGKGNTIGASIKNVGDITGWYPRLDFCNLIVIGSDVAKENTIAVMDYFAKTLRIQDSAVVVVAEKEGKEILESASPLDNISSFALQKVVLKSTGFDKDVVDTNVKTFVTGYYSNSYSAVLPQIKIKKQDDGSSSTSSEGSGGGSSSSGGSSGSGGGSNSSDNKGSALFDAKKTALFFKGKKVGEMNEECTLAYNMLNDRFSETTLEINDVKLSEKDTHNFLLTVKRCTPKFKVQANDKGIDVVIDVNLYAKISDQDAFGSDSTVQKNHPLLPQVKLKTEEKIKNWFLDIIEKSKETECDVLKIKQHLYRHNYKYYDSYEHDYLSHINPIINITVSGQK